MKQVRQRTYNAVPGPTSVLQNQEELSTGEVLEITQHAVDGSRDQITVHRKHDGEVQERYQYKVIDNIGRCRQNEDGPPPLFVTKCLAEFGFSDVESPNGLMGIYEHLLDLASSFESRGRAHESPVVRYFASSLGFTLTSIAIESMTHVVAGGDTGIERIMNAADLPSEAMTRMVVGHVSLEALPTAPNTTDPYIFQQFDTDETPFEAVDTTHPPEDVITRTQDGERGVLTCTVIYPESVGFYEFVGAADGSFSFNKTMTGDLPPPLVLEYLETQEEATFTDIPRTGDTENLIELLEVGERVLISFEDANLVETLGDDSMYALADNTFFLIRTLLTAFDIAGRERVEELIDEALSEQTETLRLSLLSDCDVTQVDIVYVVVWVAIQKLPPEEQSALYDAIIEMEQSNLPGDNDFDDMIREAAEKIADVSFDDNAPL